MVRSCAETNPRLATSRRPARGEWGKRSVSERDTCGEPNRGSRGAPQAETFGGGVSARRPGTVWRILAILVLLAAQATAGEAVREVLAYTPAPVDNPLKGLVPYAGERRDAFPHSMEFSYIGLSELMKGYDRFDWGPLEKLLDTIASRGHQTVFRVFLEFPGKKDVIPAFLIKEGLKVNTYLNTNTQPFPPQAIETPDYANVNLRKALKLFVAALGRKYDSDPRIGYITAGLLGAWGEWHNYPRDDLFAGKEVQIEVMDAYEAAFKKTPVLLRYPAGEKHPQKAPNAKRALGYHDDSFAWATLETVRESDIWFFMALIKSAGPEALDKWKTHPIGGEIRPEAWGKVFDAEPGEKQIQDFRKCVETSHVSWLMDSGMFKKEKARNEVRIKRAEEEVRRMGYEFHVPTVTIGPMTENALTVIVELENRGVAPFYYDWPVEFALLDADGAVLKTVRGAGKLTGLLPGEPPRIWDEKLDLKDVKPGRYKLALRVPNPLPQGHPMRFANRTQDADAKGWLTLGAVVRE